MAATVWKGYISFGLVSFPVRLFAAARGEAVHFHMLHKKDQSRVKEVWYCAEENKSIDRSEIEKGYEISKGKYVVVTDDELKNIAPATATAMEILQFVGRDEVDPLYFESSYYVAPEDKTAKPYSLFVAALEGTGQDAIAKVTMHNREHVVLIRPSKNSLVLHTLYYAAELHSGNDVKAPTTKYSAKELDLAKSLIGQLKAPFKPAEFKDTYRENVERLIEEKQKGRKLTATKQPAKPKVVDLMEALKQSLQSHAPAKRASAKQTSKKTSATRKAA